MKVLILVIEYNNNKAQSLNIPFYETSAKSGENIQTLFESLTRSIVTN